MTRAAGTYRLLAAALAVLGSASALWAQAATQPAAVSAPARGFPVPAADRVRAYDRPSDEGTTIIVEWPASPEGPEYVVEVAADPGDFGTDKARTVTVKPGPKALKSADPKFFGIAPGNKDFYRAEINPSKLFAVEPGELTAEEFKAFAKRGFITQAECVRAEAKAKADEEWLQELTSDLREIEKFQKHQVRHRLTGEELERAGRAIRNKKADKDLSGAEAGDRRWLELLRAYLGKKGEDDEKAEALKVNGRTYYFRLKVVVPAAGKLQGAKEYYVLKDGAPLVLSAAARPDFFKGYKLNNLFFSVTFGAVVLAFLWIARRNPNLFIRRIAGLDAVDEAIGRATEMGRPVYFVHGLGTVGDLSTMAALTILGRIARRAAEYDTRVRVMNYDPIVTAVSQEVVQQAYTEAGRPDAYNPDEVSLISSDQFAYVAAVGGMMVREEPAAIFMVGYFFAESLYLAETGASTGAIQIAGTDAYTQLPFFITTCDYTLIGEEVYAASAYLSRDPRMLGSLRGQDVGKAFLMIAIVAVTLILTAAAWAGKPMDWLANLFKTF